MSDRNTSCESRIEGELKDRVESIGEIFSVIDTGNGTEEYEDEDSAYEALGDYPLSVGSKRIVTVLISTGGPADWFEAVVDDGEIELITYVFQDWFDVARRELRSGTTEYETAERFVSYFLEALGDQS